MHQEANRIYFIGNPYPKGHKIIEFIWEGRVDEDEILWFDFHLRTDDYYAEDVADIIDDLTDTNADWRSKIVWENFHSCTLSSTYWKEENRNKGVRIGTTYEKVNFDDLLTKPILVDPLPLSSNFDYGNLAFNIYLLGHDICANHKITIVPKGDNYDINWIGRIELMAGGEIDDFEYEFSANIQNINFAGFRFPNAWSLQKAEDTFKKTLANFQDYEFRRVSLGNEVHEYRLFKI